MLEVETNGIVGVASIVEGLNTLLAETGYNHEFSNPDTVRIFREDLRVQQTELVTSSNISSAQSVQNQAEETPATGLADTAYVRRVIPKEIIVTARMREEFIQDVPISITAFDSQSIEQRSIENVLDLNVLLPNVNIRGGGTSGRSSGQFVIRGIPGVARYIDGVPQHAPQGALFDILELERIEVLRGPQGTLFGKNALSGAIQYITRKPEQEFSARLKFTGGNLERRDAVAIVDLPLTDTLFSKFTVASLNRGGYVSTAVPGFKHGNSKNDVFRGRSYGFPHLILKPR